ncbi:MAG: hypothetical protein V1722_05125 [Candidatus Micrarchaeota archaeon]
MVDTNLLLNLLEQIPAEDITVRGLSYKTKIDRRTVKKYIEVALKIQNMKKIIKSQTGLRFFIKKEQ